MAGEAKRLRNCEELSLMEADAEFISISKLKEPRSLYTTEVIPVVEFEAISGYTNVTRTSRFVLDSCRAETRNSGW